MKSCGLLFSWAFVFFLGTSAALAQSVDVFPTVSVPPFLRAGVPFTFEVDIYNDAAPGVVASNILVTNILPSGLTFISCSVAPYIRLGNTFDGSLPYNSVSSTNNGNVVSINAGNIKNAYYREIFITAVATQPGIFTNRISVTSNGTDTQPGNNLLLHALQIHTNGLSVLGGQSIPEQSGSNATFIVQLPETNSIAVTVNFRTIDGTARAGEDYQETMGTLTFPPGVTNQIVLVPVLDDLLDEADSQSFTLQLTNATNATINGGAEFNFVLDDEPTLQVSISDAPSILEGDVVTNLVFPIQLSPPADVPISVNFATSGGVTTNGTFIVPAGITNHPLAVSVIGNLTVESNRAVQVTISSPSPLGNLGQASAQGTILEDDGTPGKFDHMEISTVPSPQIVGRPFVVTLFAKDFFNNPATNYISDQVEVDAYRIVGGSVQFMQTLFVTNFVEGIGTANITYTNTATNAHITAWKPVGAWYTAVSTPQFVVVPSPTLFLSAPATATEGDGILAAAGQVSITNVDVQDVIVQLNVSDPLELAVPASVIIPAGQTSVVFDVTIVDDNRLDATHSSSIFATSTGYVAAAASSISVADNESAILSVMLPDSLSETPGFNSGIGTVSVSSPPALAVTVNLISSDTSELTVPCCAFIQAGQTSATFNVTALNDTLIDGPQNVFVTAHVTNWVDGVGAITILDNDTNLTIISQDQISIAYEGTGVVTNGLQVRLPGTSSNDIVVTLLSSDISEMIVPPEIVIPAGQQTFNTHFTLPDDNEFDGNQSVTISASAPGLSTGTRTFTVADNDVHHFAFTQIPATRTSGVPFQVSFTLKDVSNASLLSFRGEISLAALRDSVSLLMTPTVVTNFIRGSWTGNVTINGWGTNVQIVATATNGVSGQSNPFNIPTPAWAADLRIGRMQFDNGDLRLFFNSFTGHVYQVRVSTNLEEVFWPPLGPALPGTGNEISAVDSNILQQPLRFYRLTIDP